MRAGALLQGANGTGNVTGRANRRSQSLLAAVRPGIRTIAVVAAILTLIWIAGVVFIGIRVFSTFHVGFSSCLPADFPSYPQATLASVVISDSLGNCTIQYRTRDSAAHVMEFYKGDLNQGDWMVTGTNDSQGLIRFQRVSHPSTIGYVKVLSIPGQETQFQIQIRVV